MRLEQPLATGDVLMHGDRELGIVGEIRPDALMPRAGSSPGIPGEQVADLIVPSVTASAFGWQAGMREQPIGKSSEVGAFLTFAAANCQRSLITHEPLRGPNREELGSAYPARPCRLTVEQIEWLRKRGLNALVAELVCTKSDDLTGMRTLRQYQGPIDPALVPPPFTPASLRLIENEMWAFGLAPDFRTDGKHVSLTLRPATRSELLAHSRGEIKKPETINYRSYLPEPGGLLCGKIYGEDSELNTCGHFELGCGIVPYHWRVGQPSVLESLLGIDSQRIEDLLQYQVFTRGSLDRAGMAGGR